MKARIQHDHKLLNCSTPWGVGKRTIANQPPYLLVGGFFVSLEWEYHRLAT